MIKAIFISMALLSLSSLSFADLNVQNNTTSFVTGKTTNSPCSSMIGSAGILNPRSSTNIPNAAIDMMCKTSCIGFIYIDRNCSEPSKVATISFRRDVGIVSITNHNYKGFRVTGNGYRLAIEGGPKS